nr:hypothetical protein 18 [Balneolaceae bacterium]
MSRWLPKSAKSQMRRMIDGIQERESLLEAYPDDAHSKAATESIDAEIYADLLRAHLTDETIIGMLAPNLQYFSGRQISRMVSYIAGNEANLSNEDKQDLYAVFSGFNAGTTELEKLYAVDFMRRIFIDDADYYFDIIEHDEDLALELELSEGDDWSGYILTARLDSDDTLLSDGTVGDSYANAPTQTVDLGDIDLPKNRLHKIILALEEDNGAGQTNGERVKVVGHYYLFVQDLVTAGKPTATIFTTVTAPYRESPIAFIIQWDQDVEGFEPSDLQLGNATAKNFTKVNASRYTVDIHPDADGQVTIDIPAGVCTDLLGNTNNAAPQYTFTYDLVPTPVITSNLSSPTDTSPIPIQVDFGEPVTGFDQSDLQVAGGTISSFSDDGGGQYSFNITPASLNEDITVDIPEGAATDSEGNYTNAASQFAITYDNTLPVATISSSEPSLTNADPIPLSINWNEDVNGFESGDLQVSGATLQNFVQVSPSQYTAELVPDGDGQITVDIPADSVTDDGGSSNDAANQFAITYDGTAPTPSISSTTTSVTNANPIPVTIDFGEDVTGFSVSQLSLSNCAAQNFTNVDDQTYTVELVPQSQGQVTLRVPADVAQDLAGNNNLISSVFSRTFDSQAPAPAISSTANDPTSVSPVPITVDFGEFVSGFEQADLNVSGGTISGFTDVDGQTYTFNINPDSNYEQITVDVPGGVAIDDAGNPNTPASFSITYDLAGPVPTISSSAGSPTSTSPIPITISFDEDVTGFTVGDITAGNATLGNFVQTDPSTYTVEATPTGDPVQVTIDVPADVCQDNLGNNNVAAQQFTITYDASVPTPTITSSESSPTNTSPIPITVTFDENVTGFTVGDVQVSGATKSNFQQVDPQTYALDLTPDSTQENITVDVAADVAQDGSGTGNAPATQFAITYDAVGDQPVITSSEDTYTQADPIPLTITFPEAQSGFTVGDIVVGNGTVDTFADQGGGVYTCNLNPTANGACTIDIAGGVCQDQAGNNNQAADQFVIYHDTAPPTVSDSTLTPSGETSSGATVSWIKSTDAVTQQSQIRYKVYESTSNNITTVGDAEANGVEIANSLDINTIQVSLNSAQTKYIQVVSEDQAGNKLAYTSVSVTALDDTPPSLPGDPQITISNITTYGFDASVNKATDNDTAQGNLEYALFTSESANLDDPNTIEANGTIHGGWQTDPASITATGLDADTPYYTNYAVRDASGNITVYSARAVETLPAADPYEISFNLQNLTPVT